MEQENIRIFCRFSITTGIYTKKWFPSEMKKKKHLVDILEILMYM